MFVNRQYSLFAGQGTDDNESLISFDNALISAGIGNYNLVKISSILPPEFQFSEIITVPHGEVLFSAFMSQTSKKEGYISASVAVGIPINTKDIGVIMEYSGFERALIAKQKVCAMVESAMKKRGISLQNILHKEIEVLVQNTYTSVVAGIALW